MDATKIPRGIGVPPVNCGIGVPPVIPFFILMCGHFSYDFFNDRRDAYPTTLKCGHFSYKERLMNSNPYAPPQQNFPERLPDPWKKFRYLKAAHFAVIFVAITVAIFMDQLGRNGIGGVFAAMIMAIGFFCIQQSLRALTCPHCGERFFDGGLFWVRYRYRSIFDRTSYCAHCDIAAGTRSAWIMTHRKWLRRLIASSA